MLKMDVKTVCRTCLQENLEMKSIFCEDFMQQQQPQSSLSLSSMIAACTVTTVSELDGLPSQICLQCADRIKMSFQFKQQCESSYETLKKVLGIHIEPKHTASPQNLESSNNVTDASKVATEIIGSNNKLDLFPLIADDDDDDYFNDNFADKFDEHFRREDARCKPTVMTFPKISFTDEDLAPNEKCIQTDEICFYPCEMCEQKFLNEDALKVHRPTHKEFKCRLCRKIYTRLNHLRRHISVTHPDFIISRALDEIVCHVCNRQFTRTHHLRNHMEKQHNIKSDNDAVVVSNDSDSDDQCDDKENVSTIATRSIKSLKHEQQDDECIKCNVCHQLFKNEEEFNGHDGCIPNNFMCFADNFKTNEDKDNIPKAECADDVDVDAGSAGDSLNIERVKSEKVSDHESLYDVGGNDDDDDEDYVEEKKPLLKKKTYKTADDNVISSSDDDEEDEDFKPTSSLKKKRKPIKSKKPKVTSKKRKRKTVNKLPVVCKSEIIVDGENAGSEATPIPDAPIAEPKPKRMRKRRNSKDGVDNKCEICNKVFTRYAHMVRHMLTHSEVKPYSCDKCDKSFSRLDHLKNHKFNHDEVKPHYCELCKKGFTRAEHLRKHMDNRHSGKPPAEKTEICNLCNKAFTTPKYLQIHMRTHSDRSFECKVCEEKVGSKSELNEHLKKHVHERPFLCSECGLRFVRNDYLVIHMRRHKGEKPYKCKFCGKGFPRATDLNVHERYHTGEKTHLCTICGKGFQRAYNLVVHTRVHTGERPYQCPHCVKSFAQGNDLKAHIRRHTGERYKCDICGDGFIQGYHLTQHKRNIHGIDMQSHIRRVEKFLPPPAPETIIEDQQNDDLNPLNQIQQLQKMHQQQMHFLAAAANAANSDRTAIIDVDNSSSQHSFHSEIKTEPNSSTFSNEEIMHHHHHDSQSSDIIFINHPNEHQQQLKPPPPIPSVNHHL